MVSRLSAVAHRKFKWQCRETIPSLELNQIHLWMLGKTELHALCADRKNQGILSDKENVRARQIADEDKRNLYLGGRIGLRILLGEYAGIQGEPINLAYGPRGKPKLDTLVKGSRLEFNYTVSLGHAFYGFALNRELGVDLEIYPRDIKHDSFARRVLSKNESQAWQNIPLDERNNAMLCCWTRKEAYGKLLGVGIRYNMHQTDLFYALSKDNWYAKVTGLFQAEPCDENRRVCGVQVALPVPGAAALVYEVRADERGDLNVARSPDIQAFTMRDFCTTQ